MPNNPDREQGEHRKEAEEIAKVIATLLNIDPKDPMEWVWSRYGEAVMQELYAFGERRYHQGLEEEGWNCHEHVEKARKEAIERCAVICHDHFMESLKAKDPCCGDTLEREIRALLEEKEDK